MTDLLWQPSPERISNTSLSQFMLAMANKYNTTFNSYDEFHQWSIDRPEDFWQSLWQEYGVISYSPCDTVLTNKDKMPGAQWFSGATLNFAENLLKRRDDTAAIIFRDEANRRKEISFNDLYLKVAQLASALKRQGVVKGDRVAGFMPNCIESVIGMLASTSLGAIWSSCSPDFGLQGVMDRFGQIEPKVLLAVDGYFYNGKTQDTRGRVEEILSKIDSIQTLVAIDFVQTKGSWANEKVIQWDNYLDQNATEIDFVPVPFDHPLYIMYSSGTTGVPKCIVHGTGGTLLQHIKELALHTDLKADQRIFYYTTCGWMMWNWLVSSLSLGATLVLFDGSPFHPGPEVLWQLAEEENVNVFGISAKYIAALEKAHYHPREQHDLSNLNALLSTGSPLSHESFDFVYSHIKQDLCLSSISGGTDIISCFALGNPILPVYRGELQCKGLGMAVSIFNDAGQPVTEEKGELVCEHPFPSMPVGFWNDPEGKKYHNAYFDEFDNIWAHGDYGEITKNNGVIIHGRSDAVLNPGGVRIGTAEIYRQVELIDDVLDSVAIGQQWHDDVRVVLFVILREGLSLTEELSKRIKSTIRSHTTPRHVPARIVQVADIPRTISGKIVELAVRNVVHNQPVKNTDALKNPEALAYFRDRSELQG